MKIAIVCDWLAIIGGAEKVLEQMLECFPDADLFSLVDFLPDNKRHIIKNKTVTTSYIQRLPFARTKFRNYLLFMPFAIEQMDFIGYDVIISSSHAVAKGILTGPNQLHICYCHSPIRYAWDLQNQYLQESGLDVGIKTVIIRYLLHKIRVWDAISTSRVDYLIANSKFISQRIKKYYRRNVDSIIYPPVLTDITINKPREDFYLTVSRLVPYKKVDLIVDTFIKDPKRRLVVIGDGPMLKSIQNKAYHHANIEILGYQSDEVLHDYLARAKAFVFAAEEDFGILPVEAQALGCPVIAYAKGGACETVINITQPNPTGILFSLQTEDSIRHAIEKFEENRDLFKTENCILNARRFSINRFKQEFTGFVNAKIKEFNK